MIRPDRGQGQGIEEIGLARALDTWTVGRVIALAGGNAGLRDRIRSQGEALCALGGPARSEAELDTLVLALLLSSDTLLVDQPMSLRDIITASRKRSCPATPNSSWRCCRRAPERRPDVTPARQEGAT
jgi:hypothetical protein